MIDLDGAGVEVDGPDGARTILHPVTLRLDEHRIGVIGANGSGKSTLARMLNGLTEPTTGHVHVDGLDTRRDGPAVRRRVGFVFTNPAAQLVMPTAVEDVGLSLRRVEKDTRRRRALALQVLEQHGLADKADVSVHALSGGQKQLLALAGVLATEPDVVVADEPTTLLDLRNTRVVADRLFSMRQRLVLVTHDLELVQRCERVLVVEDGRVVHDGPAGAAVAFYRERELSR